MTAALHCPTRVLFSVDGLIQWCAEQPGHTAALVVDHGVVAQPIVSAVGDRLRRAGRTVTDNLDADLVVVVGGGSVIDRTKIELALRADPSLADRLAAPDRSGVVVLPDLAPRAVPLVAVPTTVGTGAEVSQVAAVSQPRGKRLVVGERLRPDVAVLDPRATESLPVHLLLEGVLEALTRVIGPYVGSHDDLPVQDALTETIAEQLVDLGYRLVVDNRAEWRAQVAQLSALSQTGLTNVGRDPFAARGWFIANELAWTTGVRKMTAVAATLPAVWRAIVAGDTRLGSTVRLHRLWTRIDPLSSEPADGLAALIDSWGIGRRIDASAEQFTAAASRVVRCWGAGLPMVGGLRQADVLALLPAPQTSAPWRGPEHNR